MILIENLPTLNASLNGLSAVLLFLGGRAIKLNQKEQHKKFMVCALISSTLFLTSYVIYHYQTHGAITKYQGEGIFRFLYYSILITHVPLAAIIVPFCIVAVYHAMKKNYSKHIKITKWLLPTWMYVSVTGVLIYLMLYVF